MSFYSGAKKICAPIAKLLYRVKISGIENVPAEGGFVVCANHTSMTDVVALAASLNRLLMFMAKKELFKFKPFGALIGKVGAFPVDRGGADVKAIKKAITLIEAGELVNIFSQGTRCRKVDPATTKIKSGAGMIAYHAKCGAIPIFVKSKNNHLHLFGKNEIIIGKPIPYEEFGFTEGGKKEYEHASRLIFSKVCALGGYDFPVDLPAGDAKGEGA